MNKIEENNNKITSIDLEFFIKELYLEKRKLITPILELKARSWKDNLKFVQSLSGKEKEDYLRLLEGALYEEILKLRFGWNQFNYFLIVFPSYIQKLPYSNAELFSKKSDIFFVNKVLLELEKNVKAFRISQKR